MVRSVLLIGLGNIGMGYDLADQPPFTRTLSHARAFSTHTAFRLIGGVDIEQANREKFENCYEIRSFKNITSAMKALSPNVVVVATPTENHYQSVIEILGAGRPEAILCEKPLAYNICDAQRLVDACSSSDCKLYVNYFRLAEPGVIRIEEGLRGGLIGCPVKGVCWYSRGLFNSAAHFLNLIEHLLGEAESVRVFNPGPLWNNIDPEPDFEVSYRDGRMIYLAAQTEHFFHNSIELLSATGRLSYERGGAKILWQGVAPDPRFAGYIQIDPEGVMIVSEFDRIQAHVTDQLAKSLDGDSAHICSGSDALKTQKTLETIRRQL
ncbi:MAG: Gfo/Idh/MocA family oxidoreductase [Syntrophaceae bacterium]|nr:Gfo/Idh/MocA family oxidoreductase [Syntrophaceae bacterium]